MALAIKVRLATNQSDIKGSESELQVGGENWK
jgi:hypothetical protein